MGLSSNNLIWVSILSECCFGVAAVFNIGVVAIFIIEVMMLDELNCDGWLSKSLLSEISEQISTSLLGGEVEGEFKTSVTGLVIL